MDNFMDIYNVSDIRNEFIGLKQDGVIADDGNYEILNACFIADEASIFGTVNKEYCQIELDWYLSESLNVNDIQGKIPAIWEYVSGKDGQINSNYGWCIFSEENHKQYESALMALKQSKVSRQSNMIYTRPTMHQDSTMHGMKDFMCTNNVQLVIRNNHLHYFVFMRSNDAVFGYKNDKFWHDYVFNKAYRELEDFYPGLLKGDMIWNAGSIHVYPRHFHLIPDDFQND